MAPVFQANQSTVKVDEETVEGVRSVEYRSATSRQDLYALGGAERIAVISGQQSVECRLRVASASPKLDGLAPDAVFQVVANLGGAANPVTVSFDDCELTEKSFSLGAGGHGEAVYAFTAIRVRQG
jgi:hypothetical protein